MQAKASRMAADDDSVSKSSTDGTAKIQPNNQQQVTQPHGTNVIMYANLDRRTSTDNVRSDQHGDVVQRNTRDSPQLRRPTGPLPALPDRSGKQ